MARCEHHAERADTGLIENLRKRWEEGVVFEEVMDGKYKLLGLEIWLSQRLSLQPKCQENTNSSEVLNTSTVKRYAVQTSYSCQQMSEK